MRTTIRIDDDLYREVKARAARSGRTVGEIIEDAIRVALAKRRPQRRPAATSLPVYGGSGVLAGVDLGTNASALDAMDDGVALDALH